VTGYDEREDIEASEAANVDLLERPLSALATEMANFPQESDAWLDFNESAEELLGVELEKKSADTVGVPQDMWDYWKAVVAGVNPNYDASGGRVFDE
jgi:hypothetical protein